MASENPHKRGQTISSRSVWWGTTALLLGVNAFVFGMGGMSAWAMALICSLLVLAALIPLYLPMLRFFPEVAGSGGNGADKGALYFRSRLIHALREPALFLTPNGRVEYANEAARRRFRFVGEAPLLSSVVRRPELLDAFDASVATGEARTCHIVVLDDPDRHYACRVTPIETEDGSGVLITMSDLTEVKRAERARADFLANASHELRTPLTSLAGFIETMRGPAKDDREAWDRFLEIMHGQADRMRRLVNDLLSLSRIELKEHDRPNDDVDFGAIVAEVADALSPLAADKGVSLALKGEASGITVRGTRDELAQVAQNLIDNALKYSERDQIVNISVAGSLKREDAVKLAGRGLGGAARMTISASPAGTAQAYAVLRVEDEGPGIDRKHLPRLSERFYRVDPGRGLRRGTGLGLAISKHIITRHQGDFLVESLVGRGTAFGVLLPMPSEPEKVVNRPQAVENES